MKPDCYGLCDKASNICKACGVFLSCSIFSLEKKKERFLTPIFVPEAAILTGRKTAIECAKQVIMENGAEDKVFSYASVRGRFIITCRVNGVQPGNIDRNIRKAFELLRKAGKLMRFSKNQWKVVG